MRILSFFLIGIFLVHAGLTSLSVPSASAATLPFSVRQAVVLVQCGNRQGSGVVINASPGYVLTNAHVLLDLEKTLRPEPCEIGFLADDQARTPSIYYTAKWERYVFDDPTNRDFAILKIGSPEQHQELTTFPFLMTDEFSAVGDTVTVLSYPQNAGGSEVITQGSISGLEQGLVKTDAHISPGSSGGPALDAQNNIIGLATRIVYEENADGTQHLVESDLVDIRAILSWLNTYGTNVADTYVTHADPARYHGPSSFITSANLQCSLLARSPLDPAVYCLKQDGTRSVFPNAETYLSWFPNWSSVMTIPVEQLATYRLTANITMRPGSLIKIATDPHVYLVTDINGTLRWVPSEERANTLFGNGWSGFVKDVPDTFFINYQVGNPLP